MPVSNWWTVIDAGLRITGGPFLWDGSSDWSPPAGQRAVNTDPTMQGYSWDGSAPGDSGSGMSAMNARLTAMENRLTTESRGVKAWPAVGVLALGATNTQRVTLKTAMPNTNYTASAFLIGGALLGSVTLDAVTIVDRQNVDVRIKAGVLVTLTLGAISAIVFADAN
jgi:hypothetical protein